ncbi:hypothetical protein GW830_01225 [bacterium]|nr:hypothetical protein [bacterium]
MLHESLLIGLDNDKIEAIVQSGKAALEPLGGSRYPMIDSHVHVVNFLQETKGFDSLITHMNGANIQKAVVF